MQKSRVIFYFFLLSLIFLFLCIVSYVGIFEDAFISFRYANNLAAGQGLVFNAGEHVWGFSNFLWTVILALGVVCGFSITAFAKYFGVISAIFIIIALFCRLLRQSCNNPYLALAGTSFLITSTHFLLASQNGLETVFFTLLVFLGILIFIDALLNEENHPWYAICFLLASMTRPEGPLFMMVAGFVEISLFIRFKKKIILKRLGLAALVFTVGYTVYVLLMYLYYDALLPNAFFVKVDLKNNHQISGGIDYLLSFIGDVRAAFLFWPLLFILTDRQRALQNVILALFLAVYLLFIIRVGGDFQVYFYRFIIPVLPLIFLLLGHGLIRMYELSQCLVPRHANSICIIIVFSLISINFLAVKSPVTPFFSRSAKRTPIVVENLFFLLRHPVALKSKVIDWFSSESMDIHPMGMVGKVLDKKLESGVSVATGQCGQIPFYLHNRRVVDMIGLMDDEVACRGMSLEYFKRSFVDYCIFYYSEAENFFIPLTLYPHLIYSDFFRENYQMEHLFHHRSIFPERGLFSEKYMLLFKKRKNPVKIKVASYNLRDCINVCFENGCFTDLKCNINGLQRGQFIGKNFLEIGGEDVGVDSFFDQVEGCGKSAVLPVRLDERQSSVSFTIKKPGYAGSCSVWTHVRLSDPADYGKVKMFVFATSAEGLRTMLGSSKTPATILAAGSTIDAWLPLICTAPISADWQVGGWQVVVETAVDADPVYVDEPILVKEPLWAQNWFEKF